MQTRLFGYREFLLFFFFVASLSLSVFVLTFFPCRTFVSEPCFRLCDPDSFFLLSDISIVLKSLLINFLIIVLSSQRTKL